MKFNFDNENYARQLDKNVFFKLSAKEKEVYLKLKRQIPVEEIILTIGDVFSKVDYRNLEKDKLIDLLAMSKSNAVLWERKMEAAEDVLTAVKRSGSNPKMIFNLFFRNRSGKKAEKPYWELTRTMYSILGIKFFDLSREETAWLNSIGLKNKYVSETEIIDPLFNILDTKEGHEFINHLYLCKNTICTCVESKKGITELIEKTKEYKKEIQNEFIIYDILIKEDVNTVLSLVNRCMDMYWITHLFHILKNGKRILNKTKGLDQSGKMTRDANNNNIELKKQNPEHKEKNE